LRPTAVDEVMARRGGFFGIGSSFHTFPSFANKGKGLYRINLELQTFVRVVEAKLDSSQRGRFKIVLFICESDIELVAFDNYSGSCALCSSNSLLKNPVPLQL
jgi:hypothetical protein